MSFILTFGGWIVFAILVIHHLFTRSPTNRVNAILKGHPETLGHAMQVVTARNEIAKLKREAEKENDS